MNKYIYLIAFILFCLSWIYPFHYMPWVVAENEFFCLLIPIVLSIFFYRYNEKIKLNIFVLIPLLIYFFSLFQYLFFKYYYLEDFIIISIYSFFFIIVIAICCNFYSIERFHFYLKLIVFLCFLNSFILFFQYIEVKNIFILENYGYKRFYANIGQPNHLSTLFIMGIVSTCLLYKYNIIKINILFLISFYFLFFIFLTGSRTGLFSCFILFLMGLFLFKEYKFKNKLIYFLSLMFFYTIIKKIFSDNNRYQSNIIMSSLNDSRLSLWSDALSSILENPWFGYGVNGIRTSRIFSDLSFKTPYVSTHNLILDFFVWFGLLGGLCLILLFFYYFIVIWSDKINREVVIVFITPFFIHCMLEYPFRYLYFLILIIPILSFLNKVKVFYIKNNIFLVLCVSYVLLIFIIGFEYTKYSKGAFFAHGQRCLIENKKGPLILDLMYDYSKLYCNELTNKKMEQIVYRYSYAHHMKFLIDQEIDNSDFQKYLLKGGR